MSPLPFQIRLALWPAVAALMTWTCTPDAVNSGSSSAGNDTPAYQVKILPGSLGFATFYDTAAIHFDLPVFFSEYPGLKGAFAVAEFRGGIKILAPDGARFRKLDFAAINCPNTDGLLGLAFHPQFRTNRKYYIYYQALPGKCLLEERMADPTFKQDAGYSRPVLWSDSGSGHDGGDMHFGADGYLYLGMGDQAGTGRQRDNLSDLHSLYGKLVRIDVDGRGAGAYGIPSDNPFVGDTAARGEIYASGLRNPWRWSFDALDGRLLLGDVGNLVQDEIDVIVKGGDYGWNTLEGTSCFDRDNEVKPLDSCDVTGKIPPLAVLPHEPASSPVAVIGGYAFRGDPGSPYYGAYIYGDHEGHAVYALRTVNGTQETELLGKTPGGMSAFGMDSKGALYMVGFREGIVYRLEHPDLQGLAVGLPAR